MKKNYGRFKYMNFVIKICLLFVFFFKKLYFLVFYVVINLVSSIKDMKLVCI